MHETKICYRAWRAHESLQDSCFIYILKRMAFSVRSFYGSRVRPSSSSARLRVESYVPNDGEDSDDPDVGGGEDGELHDEVEEGDDSDDGKCCMQ